MAELFTAFDEKLESGEIGKYMRTITSQEAALFATQIQTMSEDTQSLQAPIADSWAAFQYLNGFAKSRVWQGMNNIEQKSTIKCDDGVVLSGPTDPLACPEMQVQPKLGIEEFRNNEVVDRFASVLNPYNACLGVGDLCGSPRDVVKPVLDTINKSIGYVGGALIDGLNLIPPVKAAIDGLTNFVGKYAVDFFAWLAKKALPHVIDAEAEDEVAFDQAAMGYDVLGNTFAKGDYETPDASSIQGSILSVKDQAELDVAIAKQRKEDIQSQSFFARYFDINNTDSLASKTTIDTASLIGGGRDSLFQIQPTGIFSTIASVIGIQKPTYAFGSQDRANLFGVTQYGYRVSDPNQDVDPKTLTEEKCAEFEQLRKNSAYVNEDTGETEYTLSNPCAMDRIIIDSYTKSTDLDPLGTQESTTLRPIAGTTGQTIADFTGPVIPCEGQSKAVVRSGAGAANWSDITPTGVIGKNSAGQDMNVYVRDACAGQTNVRTVVIGASIHGEENTGQLIAHELLFNKALPPDVRIIVIPEINKAGLSGNSSRGRDNKNGVNLNRNFDYKWNYAKCDGQYDDPGCKGPSAASEPETQAIQNFLTTLGRSSLVINYHTPKNWVGPSGPDISISAAISQKYSEYSAIPSIPLNRGFGFFESWYNDATGTPALIVELDDTVVSTKDPYVQRHADAIVKLLAENVVE